MEWKVVVHEPDRYVEVVTAGLADKDGSLMMAESISKAMRAARATRALIDHRGISGVSGSAIDIYDRPSALRFIGAILRIRIAEVVRPEHQEHFAFFETVCRNQGFQFAVFNDPEDARAWLLG